MRRKIMALCDPDAVYAVHFTEYACRRANIPFEIHAFTEVPALAVFAAEERVELLLISSRLMGPEVKELGIPGIIVLTEEKAGAPSGSGYKEVFKYRSQAEVIREVMAAYGQTAPKGAGSLVKPGMRTVGVFSPAGRCGKTSLALALGQILGNEKRTLYVNLEPFSGLSRAFPATAGGNLTDLIFCLRQEEGAAAARLSGMTLPLGSLDILPPARPGREIFSVGGEDWKRFFELVRDESGYEVLILDIGCGLNDCLACLLACDVIFMPVRGEAGSAAKTEEVFDWLREEEAEEVIGKIRRLSLKDPGNCGELRDLPYTVYGSWARELIRKEGL